MAVILLSFIATSLFLVSLATTEQNYRILNCKVTPVGENLESEFRLKASEKGVRIVYLNLKIGNNSYNPLDLPDEFLPDRWVSRDGCGLGQIMSPCCLCRSISIFYPLDF